MPKKMFRVRDEKGGWVEIDPKKFVQPPLKHRKLSARLLTRIGKAHAAVKDVIRCNGHPMSLEQFEVSFMRANDPDREILLWEAMVSAFDLACGLSPDGHETRAQLFRWVLLLVMSAVTDEEQCQEDVALVRECIARVAPTLIS